MNEKYREDLKKLCLYHWDVNSSCLDFLPSLASKIQFTRRVVNIELNDWGRMFSLEFNALTRDEKQKLADELVNHCLLNR